MQKYKTVKICRYLFQKRFYLHFWCINQIWKYINFDTKKNVFIKFIKKNIYPEADILREFKLIKLGIINSNL